MQAVHEMNATLRPARATANEAVRTMRAIVHPQYGAPDVLQLAEVERPIPGDDDVLVRVHAAGVNIGDHHVVTGKPYLIRLSPFGGLPRPRNRVPGACLAGRVEAVGAQVTSLRVGDEVFGQALTGAFAEYVVVPAALLAPRPSNLSLQDAAAVPWGATALQGLRDAGGLRAGQRVLIVGASGGVGTWAVQIGKALGAHVTAVCSARNVEMVRDLGADDVIDYETQDFVVGGARFDVVFDLIGERPLPELRSVLKPGGAYVACAGGGGDWVGPIFRLLGGLVSFLFSSQRFKTFVAAPRRDDLLFLKELVEVGKAKPVIERRYPLAQVGEALRHVGAGHAQGQTILRVVD